MWFSLPPQQRLKSLLSLTGPFGRAIEGSGIGDLRSWEGFRRPVYFSSWRLAEIGIGGAGTVASGAGGGGAGAVQKITVSLFVRLFVCPIGTRMF